MAELVRRGYEAVERGDITALDEMLADDVTWHGTPGSSNERLSRDYDGKAAVFGFFSELGRLSSGTLRRDVARLTRTDRMWTGAGPGRHSRRAAGAARRLIGTQSDDQRLTVSPRVGCRLGITAYHSGL